MTVRNDGPGWAGLKSAGFDPEALWKRVQGDPDLLRELIAVFESEFPGMLASVQTAVEGRDAAQLEKAAHKAKGAVLQFSAAQAAVAALELEQLGRSGTVAGAGGILERLEREARLLLEHLHAMTGGAQE